MEEGTQRTLPAHLCLGFPSYNMGMTTLISQAEVQNMWEGESKCTS